MVPAVLLCQQVRNPTQQGQQPAPDAGPNPIFRIEVVGRTAQAVNYRHRGGADAGQLSRHGDHADGEGRGQGGE